MSGLFGGARRALGNFARTDDQGRTFGDKLGIIGATMRSVSDPSSGAIEDQVGRLQQSLAQRQHEGAKQQALSRLNGSLFGGGRPAPAPFDIEALAAGNPGPTDSEMPQQQQLGLPTLRQAAPDLIRAQQAGIPIGDYVSLLDKTGPDIQYERGHRYDRRDPSSAPAYAPDLAQGEEPVFDARGNIVGTRNLEGTVSSLAARTRAQEDAKNASQASYAGAISEATAAGSGRGASPYQIETVQGPDGPVTASRAALLGQGPIYGTDTSTLNAREARPTSPQSLEIQGQMDINANEVIPTLNRMREALQSGDVLTGFGAEAKLGAARLAAAGGNQDAQRVVAATEAYQNMSGRLRVGMAKTLGVNPSDADLKLLTTVTGGNIGQNQQALISTIDQGLSFANNKATALSAQLGQASGQQSSPPARPAQSAPSNRAALEAEARRRGLIR